MPLRNEHAARQHPPQEFVRFFRKYFGRGVAAIMGVTANGALRTQSLRFDKTLFTPAQARSWLARHGYRTDVEPAREEERPHAF